MVLSTQFIPFFLAQPLSLPRPKRKLFEPTALKIPSFLLYSIALFFTFAGLYIPFFYAEAFAEQELHVSGTTAFYLLSIMNAGSFFGRVGLNLIANRFGPMQVCLACIFLSGVLAFCWTPVSNLAGFIVWAVIYGVFSGGVVSLLPTAMVAISADLSKFATRLGMASGFAGLGILVGNPSAGAIVTSSLSYRGMEVFTGIIVLLGFISLLGSSVAFKWSQTASTKSNQD